MESNTLLIIWHSRTGASKALAAAASKGAGGGARLLRARDVNPEDLFCASGYLFICPENLAAVSGEMKEMFDRCYYPALGKIEGRAYATIIAAGSDGEGAQRQIDRIATGWRLRRVMEPCIVVTEAQTPEQIEAQKILSPQELLFAEQIGCSLTEALAQGIY